MTDYSFVVDKLQTILNENDNISTLFFNKWGVDKKSFKLKITNPLTHGGYISKSISINNIEVDKDTTVLDIGPEMGLEVFMLSESAKKIIVCDPDQDNLMLIKLIAEKYVNNAGLNVGEIVEFRPLGFNNSDTFVIEEKNRYEGIVEKLGHSLPAFYNVSSSDAVRDITETKFDLVFVHKILTTITRSNTVDSYKVFRQAVDDILPLLENDGICSWTEPEFVFEQKQILSQLRYMNQLKYSVIDYQPKELPEKFIQLLIGK